MRIVLMSDSHGDSNAVLQIVERNIYTADMFIHLGDGENDMWRVVQEYPDVKIHQVRGNCDGTNKHPDHLIIDTIVNADNELVKIFVTHGHLQHVKTKKEELIQMAKDNNCSIVAFGHTHRRCDEVYDGIRLVNPGSCACPRDNAARSYAYIDISFWGIIVGIEELS